MALHGEREQMMGEGVCWIVKKTNSLQQYNTMSAVLDGEAFSASPHQSSPFRTPNPTLITELSKKISADSASTLLESHPNSHIAITRTSFKNREYLVKIEAECGIGGLTISLSEIGPKGPIGCIGTRGSPWERELVYHLSILQYSTRGEAVFFLREGRVWAEVRILLPAIPTRSRTFIDIYYRLIHKNIQRMHLLLPTMAPQPHSQFLEELALTTMMHTDTNLDFSQERMQYRQGQAALRQQRQQLKKLIQNISPEGCPQKTLDFLFFLREKEAGGDWLKANMSYLSEALHQRYRNVYQLPRTQKKIEDFVYNTVEIELKDRMARPVAQGGSSVIYLYKAMVAFVSSQDFSDYRIPREKAEKLLAVKMLKGGLQSLRPKLDHERKIVARMHGGCCFFLPRYYWTRGQEFSHCLLMEYLNGEPLDRFSKSRKETLSLRSKLFLLFHLVHGMRFLIGREITHLDLKPANVVVCKQLIPKILDFGSAYHHELCPKDYVPGFTVPYTAPEVWKKYENRLNNKETQSEWEYSEKQDVFSFGLMMHELFFGTPLFTQTIYKIHQLYRKGDPTSAVFLAPQSFSLFGQDLVMSTIVLVIWRCLQIDPGKRPKFDWLGVLLKVLLNHFNSH